MSRRQVDPAQLRGDALAKWYRRSPDEIEEARNLRAHAEHDAFYGVVGNELAESWQEARVAPPSVRADVPLARPLPAPGRSKVAPRIEGIPQAAGAPGSFFAESSTLGGDYFNPSLPAPLNRVQPIGRDRYLVQDSTSWTGASIVSADEVERVYAEQKRLVQGDGESEPAAHVRAADRFKDGFIPRADQLEKSDRELDPTCHPYGGWELDPQFPKFSERTKKYEKQITRAPGLDYVVRVPGKGAVKFDGCAVWDPDRQLLEAKGRGREGILDFLHRLKRPVKMLEADANQVLRQNDAAGGRRVDWHAAELRYKDALQDALSGAKIPRPPTFNLYHTPAR